MALQATLADQDRTLQQYNLPLPMWDWKGNADVRLANVYVPKEEAVAGAALHSQLNSGQLQCFDTIVASIETTPATSHFYLQGPSGTGKTFLYKAICHYMRGKQRQCFVLRLLALQPCFYQMAGLRILGLGFQSSSQDEVPMQHKFCFEAVHRLLCDIRPTTSDSLFRGVPIILRGDFSQILPVMPGKEQSAIVVGNENDEAFIKWISSIPFCPSMTPMATIPPYINMLGSINDLISTIYPLATLT
ncbi:hypothetical protein V498_10553 [Pseudogymnoascus sp. VKM F-4517 (FW-2822)]|nr:hypothetical protein V498_10553 [Pseudogymnoascus sp. VKM F-4517 (FW-2822)]